MLHAKPVLHPCRWGREARVGPSYGAPDRLIACTHHVVRRFHGKPETRAQKCTRNGSHGAAVRRSRSSSRPAADAPDTSAPTTLCLWLQRTGKTQQSRIQRRVSRETFFRLSVVGAWLATTPSASLSAPLRRRSSLTSGSGVERGERVGLALRSPPGGFTGNREGAQPETDGGRPIALRTRPAVTAEDERQSPECREALVRTCHGLLSRRLRLLLCARSAVPRETQSCLESAVPCAALPHSVRIDDTRQHTARVSRETKGRSLSRHTHPSDHHSSPSPGRPAGSPRRWAMTIRTFPVCARTA
jgi:hypothetical protein